MVNTLKNNSELITKQTVVTDTDESLDHFVSMREIIQKLLRHRKAIGVCVSLSTLAALFFFLFISKKSEAEGYLQVIPPPASKEGRVDRELFETMIVSNLQRISSAYIAENVSTRLKKEGVEITPLKIMEQIKITRPPKSDLVRIVAQDQADTLALLIVREWIREYVDLTVKNNIAVSLSLVRSLLSQVQSELMEKQAAADKLRNQVSQIEPLVTVLRSVDDHLLWTDLTRKGSPDPDTIKKLSEIHLRSQEQSTEYINLKITLSKAEQDFSAVLAKRNLFQEVERILEDRTATLNPDKSSKITAAGSPPSEAELYTNALIKNSQVVQFGEPALILGSRMALLKIALVFLASLAAACIYAFVYEWWNDPEHR